MLIITIVIIRRPYRSACGNNTNLEWYQLSFWNKPMLLTPSDMKTLKYNNLTNLTGMIWHIDPATKILETNQFWKLAFRIRASFKSRKWPICLPEGSKAYPPSLPQMPCAHSRFGKTRMGRAHRYRSRRTHDDKRPPLRRRALPTKGQNSAQEGGCVRKGTPRIVPMGLPHTCLPATAWKRSYSWLESARTDIRSLVILQKIVEPLM